VRSADCTSFAGFVFFFCFGFAYAVDGAVFVMATEPAAAATGACSAVAVTAAWLACAIGSGASFSALARRTERSTTTS
jgi:hypothetical protein